MSNATATSKPVWSDTLLELEELKNQVDIDLSAWHGYLLARRAIDQQITQTTEELACNFERVRALSAAVLRLFEGG